jgi:GntR family transcriptional regulator
MAMTSISYTDPMEPTPRRVVQAARGIQAIIDRGEPGDRLPSEVDLARQLSVSRVTVRDALSRLWVQGLVTRRWGYGTFISERPKPLSTPVNAVFLDLEEVGSLPRQVTDAGHTPSITRFELSTVVPPAWIAEEFGLEPGEKLRCVERCIAVDDRATFYLRDYVPLLVNGMELELDLLSGTLSDFPSLFRDAGLRLVKQAARMDGQLPDPDVAEAFGIPLTTPVLHAEQRSYAETGALVIGTDAYYLTDVFGMVVVRTLTS